MQVARVNHSFLRKPVLAMRRIPGPPVRIIAFLDQGVVSGGNFVAGILMARAFGAYEFGWFTLSWLVVEFMASLQFAAVIQPMLNIGAKEDEFTTTRYYSAAAIQQVVVGICSTMIVWTSVKLAAEFLDAEFGRLALPLCLATAAMQAQNFMRRYLFARGRPFVALLSDSLRMGLQIAALAFLLHLGEATGSEAGTWIAAGACAAASLTGLPFFGPVDWDGSTFRQVLSRHWSFSKWLVPSAVLFWMTSQAFVIMSGIALGAATTGKLKAAISIVGVITMMLQALDNFAPTQAAQALHRGGADALMRYMARLSGFTAILLAVPVALLTSETDWLVHLVYGGGYQGLGYMVRWLCVGVCLYAAAVLLGIWAAAIERTRMIFFSYAMAAIFTTIACYPMTLHFGIEGVLAGALLVELIKAVALLVPLMRWRSAKRGLSLSS
jgi:O-antigen/teichoic acid export membrane protein